jgi:uncharacterized protein
VGSRGVFRYAHRVPTDLTPYVDAWRERFRRAEESRQERARKARALLPTLVRHLVERYGARRVWLFGSLAHGGFHERSDIDLAAEGLPPGHELFLAGAELDDLASPFRVELVPLEDARPEVRERILSRGERLHGT